MLLACSQSTVNCFVDPCSVEKCPAFPHATCVSNYCGGCNAEFYVKGKKVNCNDGCVKEVRENAVIRKSLFCLQTGECDLYIFGIRPSSDRHCCPGLRCCSDRPVEQAYSDLSLNGVCREKCLPLRG